MKRNILLVSICSVLLLCLTGCNDNQSEVNNTNGKDNPSYNEDKTTDKKEEYHNTDYDGVYSFSYNTDNGTGSIFHTKGYLKISNGDCVTINRTNINITSNDYTNKHNYSGTCILDEDNDFVIDLSVGNRDYEQIKYTCQIINKNLSCTLTSELGISGCREKSISFNYFSDLSNYQEKINEQIKLEEATEKEEKEKQEKEALAKKVRTFTAGTYVVGRDIDPGIYNIIAVSGRGNCFVDSNSRVIETFTPGGDKYAIDRYNNVDLATGGTIEVKSTLKVKFEPVS